MHFPMLTMDHRQCDQAFTAASSKTFPESLAYKGIKTISAPPIRQLFTLPAQHAQLAPRAILLGLALQRQPQHLPPHNLSRPQRQRLTARRRAARLDARVVLSLMPTALLSAQGTEKRREETGVVGAIGGHGSQDIIFSDGFVVVPRAADAAVEVYRSAVIALMQRR